MKQYLRATEVARLLMVSPSTVRNFADAGKLPSERNVAGQRVFRYEDVMEFKNGTGQSKTVFYVRSSSGDKELMDAQERELRAVYGDPFMIIKDRASGMNEKRQGLERLMALAQEGEVTDICVTYPDRLTRFGFLYLTRYFDVFGVTVRVLHENDNKTPHEELMSDFMSLVASFAGRFHRLRSKAAQEHLLVDALDKVRS